MPTPVRAARTSAIICHAMLTSRLPHVACLFAAFGAVAEPGVTGSSTASVKERSRDGASAGVKVGAGSGVALGAAAAPVMGGAFAVLILAGAAMKGGEIGGLVGARRSGEVHSYPSPVVLHIKSEAPGGHE